MSYRLYNVTLTELRHYQMTVAASTPDEATCIAKTVLDEATTPLAEDLKVLSREVDAKAELATGLTVNRYRVQATYSLDLVLLLPAADRHEAERHARRLYDENCGPHEFDMVDERVGAFHAQEVV